MNLIQTTGLFAANRVTCCSSLGTVAWPCLLMGSPDGFTGGKLLVDVPRKQNHMRCPVFFPHCLKKLFREKVFP